MKNVTAIVISFLRPGYTKACVASLRERYPDIGIVVGENGNRDGGLAEACARASAKYVQLPYDSGVCAARNRLVSETDTPYVLVGDDDFFYTDSARAEDMAAALDAEREIDLIGGRVSQGGTTGNYQGFIDHSEGRIKVDALDVGSAPWRVSGGIRWCPVDLAFNFFVARTESVRAVPWDEQIKVAYEHLSWFLDFKKAGFRAAFTPDSVVVHKPSHVDPEQSPEYAAFRNRRNDKDRFFRRFGITHIIGMNGERTDADAAV